MQISQKAISAFKGNNKLMGRIMIEFDRGQNAIEKWLSSKDVRLTTPNAVRIIQEETGMSQEEILQDVSELEPQSTNAIS